MPDNDTYSISVVIPSCERRASVERLLTAFASQTLPPHDFEVIVALNGADDGTAAMIDRLGAPYPLRYVWHGQRTRAGACNAGARVACGRLLVFLDDDMEPAPEFLQGHLAAHPPGSSRGVVGAAPIHFDASSPGIVAYRALGFRRKLEQLAASPTGLRFNQVYTGNFSIPRHLFLAVGGFDEEFQLYGYEDYELVLRLRKIGVEFAYSAEALAHQHYAKDFAALADNTVASGKMAVLFARKHPEIFSQLELSQYAQGSRRQRYLRALLLGLSRTWDGVPAAVVRIGEWLDSRRSARLHAFYDRAFDYFYWYGVERALRSDQRRVSPFLGRRLKQLAS
ncbi:glycosyltransferase family 2 protein [soil metagenome]